MRLKEPINDTTLSSEWRLRIYTGGWGSRMSGMAVCAPVAKRASGCSFPVMNKCRVPGRAWAAPTGPATRCAFWVAEAGLKGEKHSSQGTTSGETKRCGLYESSQVMKKRWNNPSVSHHLARHSKEPVRSGGQAAASSLLVLWEDGGLDWISYFMEELWKKKKMIPPVEYECFHINFFHPLHSTFIEVLLCAKHYAKCKGHKQDET